MNNERLIQLYGRKYADDDDDDDGNDCDDQQK